jgi:hypothetical protein
MENPNFKDGYFQSNSPSISEKLLLTSPICSEELKLSHPHIFRTNGNNSFDHIGGVSFNSSYIIEGVPCKFSKIVNTMTTPSEYQRS